MNDTRLTVIGNVVDSPRRVRTAGGAVTNFRMASTERRYDGGSQSWTDGATLWMDVECWDQLGANVSATVSKGDPVIAVGTLTTHSWESEHGRRSAPRLRAVHVGPDLRRGSAIFKRTGAAVRAASGAELPPAPGSDAADGSPSRSLADGLAERDYVTTSEAFHPVDTDGLPSDLPTEQQPEHAFGQEPEPALA